MTAIDRVRERQLMNTVKIIYVGQRIMRNGKPGHFYAHEDGTSFGGWVKPLVPGARIGTLIEVTETDDDKVIVRGPNGPKVIGPSGAEPETMVGWQVANDLAKMEAAKQATERRLVREVGQPFEDALAVLSKALDGLPWTQRAVAVNMIVSRLNR